MTPLVRSLTDRQEQVAELLADGLTDKEIAVRLGIARSTASEHVAAVRARLQAENRTEAATRWLRERMAAATA